MARIVVAGAGAAGASIAYHLSELGAEAVVLCDRGSVAGGATAKAMGGVRQQFSTPAEVKLAQASLRFFEELGSPFFDQVGYLFLATTEAGLAELEERAELDDATKLAADVFVIAAGPWSAQVGRELGVELPIRPLCRQLLETEPIAGLPPELPMTVEAESGFHFRRRGDRLVLAMSDPEPRWGFDEVVDESLFDDRLERLVHRFPAAAGTRIDRAWAGLYDMTPDAHPILGRVGEGVYAACGFSGHGFMQSPAVGRAVAEEILGLEPTFDLSPYRLDRFERGAIFPEQLVL